MPNFIKNERCVEELMRNVVLDILALGVGESVTFPFRDGPTSYLRTK